MRWSRTGKLMKALKTGMGSKTGAHYIVLNTLLIPENELRISFLEANVVPLESIIVLLESAHNEII